jgi:hypothetical protein
VPDYNAVVTLERRDPTTGQRPSSPPG